MKVNNIKLMCDLGYKVIVTKSEKTIWFQKHITEYTIKDIMIIFDKKYIICEVSYYSTNRSLIKAESQMTFDEFDIIKEILAEGEDDIFKDKYDHYGNILY